MKTKKGLLMVVLLLAISSLMAAMSYSSATVTSAMTGTVVSTDKALLALNVGDHRAATIEGDVLKIDFNKGNNSTLPVITYGVQKQSEYVWNGLFTVKNNSEHVVAATIKTENNPAAGIVLYAKVGNGTWTKIDSLNGASFDITKALKTNTNNEVKVDIKLVVEKNASLGNFNPNLVVVADAKQ